MYDPKYITYEHGGITNIIVFGASIDHRIMTTVLGITVSDVIGAGFVNFEQRRCYGKSVSLGIESHISDNTILKLHMNLNRD